MSVINDRAPVTVIGLGPMGRAMAAALMRPGTRSRCGTGRRVALTASSPKGATRAASPAAAVAGSDLIVLSLTDYPAMHDILGPIVSLLAGKSW